MRQIDIMIMIHCLYFMYYSYAVCALAPGVNACRSSACILPDVAADEALASVLSTLFEENLHRFVLF
jgi:hypothetical protein